MTAHHGVDVDTEGVSSVSAGSTGPESEGGSAGRAARTRPGVRRLVLLALVTAVSVATGLAVYLASRHSVYILPPESAADAAMRQSPENAYQTLAEAAQLAPPGRSPNRSWLDETDNQSPTLGRTTLQYFERSDSDLLSDLPRLQRRAQEWAPAAEQARAALAKSYYRIPIRWSDCEILNFSWYPESYWNVTFLGRAMVTEGVYYTLAPDTMEQGVRWLIDALKLGALLATDGPGREGREVQNWALGRLCVVAHSMSNAQLTEALAAIQRVEDQMAPPIRNLEFEWRVLDNTRKWDPHFPAMGEPPRRNPSFRYGKDVLFSVALGQVRGLIASHRIEFQEALSLPYPRALTWLDEHPNLALPSGERRMIASVLGRNYWPALRSVLNPVAMVRMYVEEYARLRTWMLGAEYVLALELFRQDHGSYPEALDALTPRYLAEMTDDPYSELPLEYRAENGDYTLFSAGPVPTGGIGATEGQYELVLHRAPISQS